MRNFIKKFLVFLTFIFISNFVYSTTCTNATIINPTNLPIYNQSIACGSTNDITYTTTVSTVKTGGCTNSFYYGGRESLYRFTPTSSGTYTISYNGQNWTQIMVTNGCPTTAGSTCVGGIASYSSSKNLIVNLTAGVTYYIMFDIWPNPNSPCPGTFSIAFGCANSNAFVTVNAPTNNNILTISTCTYQTNYNTINNVVAGNQYRSTYSLGGYITVRSGTFNGPVVAQGNSPLTWTAGVSGTHFIHYNTNSSCGTATNCGTSTIQCLSCGVTPPSCVTTPTPINGTTNILLTQQLSWPAVTSATGYDVYFGTTSPANTPVSLNQTGTTYNPGTLNPNTTYYWRVVPRNSNGPAIGCSTWSFTTGLAGCLTADNGQWPTSTFNPQCNGTSETIVIDAFASEYSLVNVESGTQYTFSSSVSTDFITIGNSTGTTILVSGNTPLTWTSTVTGTIRFYRHTNSSCGASTTFRIISIQCGQPDPGPCFGITYYSGADLPTQSNPTVQSLCLGIDPPFGQFTDEYTEWTNGVAGTDYMVISSESSDWITITESTPNGTVIGFGSSPYSWVAPNNGTYYIHVSTDEFCGQDFNCRDITVERVSVLPVTLTSFTTGCENGVPLLKWTTASEQNSDYFQIERSRNGIEWAAVSQVKAMGNSNTTKNYQFYDMTAGGNFDGYYRLKQVDFDGNFEYFGPNGVECYSVENTSNIEIFPNPVKSDLFIGIRNSILGDGVITITDFSGKIIKYNQVKLSKGYNLIEIDVKTLLSGVYIINVVSNDVKFVDKFVKH